MSGKYVVFVAYGNARLRAATKKKARESYVASVFTA